MPQLSFEEFPQGRRTDPAGKKVWYTGDDSDFIAFDYQMLDDGRVVLHSALHSDTQGLCEDFLFEVVRRDSALHAARTMVWDAEDYLEEATGDMPASMTEQDFIDHLKQALNAGLH